MDLLEEALAGPPTMSRHQSRTVFEGEEDTCDTIKTKDFLIHFQVGSSWSETRREGEGRRETLDVHPHHGTPNK